MSSPSGNSSLQYSFTGKRVLITGGGGGIGRSLVERLHNDGAQVFVLELNPSAVEELKKLANVTAEVCDITKWDETQKLIESFGPLDHLINNAAIFNAQTFMELTEDSVTKQLDVNLKAVLCVTQAVARGMISAGNGGSIVNIASLAGVMAYPQCSVYGAAKAGIAMLSKSLAQELGNCGIRVNSFSPTGVNTELFRAAQQVTAIKDWCLKRQPLQGKQFKHYLELEDAVNSILFLLSPLSSLTNGHNMVVDGGISVC